jgi:hypothetical protein
VESERPPDETIAEQLRQNSSGLPIRERYGFVLALILLAYVLSAFESSRLVTVTTTVLWAALLLITLWAPAVPRRVRSIGVGALVLILVISVTLTLASDDDTVVGWQLLLLAIAQLAAFLAILIQIVNHDRVTLQTVMGGIAAYALLGFVSAAVFNGIDMISDQEFLNGVVGAGDYLYFSFVTLTTVGYGDITAASELAKRLVVVEAFVGQVFIIVFVARLVSLWGQPLRRA